MRIVIANHSLDFAGGIESYSTTVADQLQRTGHDVVIYAAEDGFTGTVARRMGLRVATSEAWLPSEVDVVLAQDGAAALEMLEFRPTAPQIFFWHSDLFDLHLPPQLDCVTARIVTLWGGARRKAEALAVSAPIVELAHPIDVERFKPRRPLRDHPRAVALGNYLTGERLRILERACELAGIELELWGLHSENGVTDRPEDAINSADIVFAKAKAAVEAMACGRAVFVFDAFGSDGWVTPDHYARLEASCFAGTGATQPVDEESIASALAAYSPAMGVANRDLAVANHSAIRHVAEVAKLAKEVAAEVDSIPPMRHEALPELARLTRVNWRHESRAFSADARLQQSELKRRDLELALQRSEAERAAALNQANVWERQLSTTVNSRRWRILNALMAPIDLLRGRR